MKLNVRILEDQWCDPCLRFTGHNDKKHTKMGGGHQITQLVIEKHPKYNIKSNVTYLNTCAVCEQIQIFKAYRGLRVLSGCTRYCVGWTFYNIKQIELCCVRCCVIMNCQKGTFKSFLIKSRTQ